MRASMVSARVLDDNADVSPRVCLVHAELKDKLEQVAQVRVPWRTVADCRDAPRHIRSRDALAPSREKVGSRDNAKIVVEDRARVLLEQRGVTGQRAKRACWQPLNKLLQSGRLGLGVGKGVAVESRVHGGPQDERLGPGHVGVFFRRACSCRA